MQLGFPERLELLIDRLKLNANSFAEQIKTPPPVIYNSIGGRKTRPSFEVLAKIKNRFGDVDLNWLISGVGEMFIPGQMEVREPQAVYAITPRSREGITIPIITLKAAANALRGIETHEQVEALDQIVLPAWMLNPGVHVGVQLKGLSMHPVLHDGSITILTRIERENWGSFKSGHIHLIYSETYGAQIKYLRRSERNPSFLLMESENVEDNPAISLSVEEVHQVWSLDLSLNFKFISQRKQILERVNNLEAAIFEMSLMLDALKSNKNERLE